MCATVILSFSYDIDLLRPSIIGSEISLDQLNGNKCLKLLNECFYLRSIYLRSPDFAYS